MTSWLIARIISSGLAAKFVAGLLVKAGIKSTIANALAPAGIRALTSIADAVKRAQAEGMSDEDVIAAAEYNLPPNHPDKKVTLEEILRGDHH